MEITTLKDWCAALEDQSKLVKKYENKLTSFYRNLKVKPDFDTPFMTGCYNKEKFIFGIFRKLLFIISMSLICSILSVVILSINNIDKTHTFISNIKNSVVPACVAFILFSTLYILYMFAKYKIQKSSLRKLENKLSDFLTTVPMNYRASDKMKTMAMVYFTKPTIEPGLILLCTDNYIKQTGRNIPYTSVMFDLPCECPFLGDSIKNNGTQNVIDTSINKRSEYLPKDIDTKICKGANDSDKELQEMIGLNTVKDQIAKFENRIKFYGKDSNNGCHLAFLGSAGTGKTTVARIVTKILYDLGYIKNNQYIEISGDYLCAGDTNRANAIIEYAYGGVLFIDEAYLMEKRGFEVIGILLKAMEDHRKDFVCILAGYEEQMTRLFATNEGFTSRIKHTIYFPDYTEDEMLDIFNYFTKNYNGDTYRLDESAIDTLKNVFSLEKKSKSFGNARTVRNAVDAIMDNYADRSIKEQSNTHVISLSDVQLYADNRKVILQHELKNTSAADQVDEQIIRLSELKPHMKTGSENPDIDLANLIGLDSFKQEIDILRNQKEFYNQITQQKILLIGDDCSGKTTLTKILTGYLYQLGYITENKYLEIPAELFKGSFVGHTAKRAQSIISYATGGVLYIKNYNLLVNSNDSFSAEAISAINSAINENNDVTIVLGDYKSDIIESMKSMFTLVYELPKYTNEQLLFIFDRLLQSSNFTITDDARQDVWSYLFTSQSNIRDIQSIVNTTIKQHISNFNGDESNKFLIEKNDLVFLTSSYSEELPKNNDLVIKHTPDKAIESVNNTLEINTNNIPNININYSGVKPKIKLNLKPKN